MAGEVGAAALKAVEGELGVDQTLAMVKPSPSHVTPSHATPAAQSRVPRHSADKQYVAELHRKPLVRAATTILHHLYLLHPPTIQMCHSSLMAE
ncbi:MAG: hypothetical protein M3Q81_01745 [bacterium]|nr:hypothetical protein [bacterium]